ncbi:MAG: hypothetical protein KKA07_07420 [Bacteroidetes bacterium]|nr:hypothetical protein [Bacteroidota bacterium]MBU1718890.1 hypothetical protein [Bacteroidota bacterium]
MKHIATLILSISAIFCAAQGVVTQPQFTIERRTDAFNVANMAFSTDGKLLACGCKDGFFKIWNTSDYSEKWSIEAHNKAILAVQFSPDNQWLLTGSRDNLVRIWDVGTGEKVIETEEGRAKNRKVEFTLLISIL